MEKLEAFESAAGFAENNPMKLDGALFRWDRKYRPRGLSPDYLKDRNISFIIGENPSKYSASVFMWNAEFKERDVPEIFLPLDISIIRRDNLKKVLDLAFEAGKEVFRVLTITNPYKVEALQYFAEIGKNSDRVLISEDARRIGATNQILIGPDNKFRVINSDGLGMAKAIESFLKNRAEGSLEEKKVILIGAGGAARGIAYEIAKKIGKFGTLSIVNRTPEKALMLAQELWKYFRVSVRGFPLEVLKSMAGRGYDLLVSSITEGDPLKDSGAYDVFPEGFLIVDSNYGAKSVLVENAKAAGRSDLDVKDGAGMVVEGYVIPSQELGKLWGYEVAPEIYAKIAGSFGYIASTGM